MNAPISRSCEIPFLSAVVVALFAGCTEFEPTRMITASSQDITARETAVGVSTTVINFDSDVPGAPPATGGPNQPNFLFTGDGTTILVQSAANGITTQPVVETHSAFNRFSTVGFAFPSVTAGAVTVEATVSLGTAVNCYFLQTGVSDFGAVATRFHALANGQVTDFFGTPVGIYVAGQPFRVRMDIDMTAHNWSAVVDDELNGFADDAVTSNLPFVNPVGLVPSLGAVNASFAIFVDQPATSIAYDDISITISCSPPAISSAAASPQVLWPPNHEMVDVTVNYTVAGCASTCTLSVTSDEPIQGTGDGDTSPDWVIVDANHVRLRAERGGTGTGRVYMITITCTNAAGETSQIVTVAVPRDQTSRRR